MIIARLVGSVSVVSSKINLSMLACTILSTVELLTERLARPMERLNSGAMRQGCSISRSSEKQNFLQSIVPIPAFVCIILLTLRGLKSGQRGTTRPPDVSTNLRSPEMNSVCCRLPCEMPRKIALGWQSPNARRFRLPIYFL